jgi:nitroreductase
MDIHKIIKSRRSIRNFTDKKVTDEDLDTILEAARWAPSAVNRQPWHFVVVKDKILREKIGSGPFAKHVREAPVTIVICADIKKSRWAVIDCSLAAQNIMLQAHALGLGTCFVGSFSEKNVKKVLSIPDSYKIIGLFPLGYPQSTDQSSIRVNVTDIFSVDSFNKKKSIISNTKKGAASFITKSLS